MAIDRALIITGESATATLTREDGFTFELPGTVEGKSLTIATSHSSFFGEGSHALNLAFTSPNTLVGTDTHSDGIDGNEACEVSAQRIE